MKGNNVRLLKYFIVIVFLFAIKTTIADQINTPTSLPTSNELIEKDPQIRDTLVQMSSRIAETEAQISSMSGSYEHLVQVVTIATYAVVIITLIQMIFVGIQTRKSTRIEERAWREIEEGRSVRNDVLDYVRNETSSRNSAIQSVKVESDNKVEEYHATIRNEIADLREAINQLVKKIELFSSLTEDSIAILLQKGFQPLLSDEQYQELSESLGKINEEFFRIDSILADLFSGNDKKMKSAIMFLYVYGGLDHIRSLKAFQMITDDEDIKDLARQAIDGIQKRLGLIK
ncbi:hypothetical protein KKC97_02690 [bacterium]|nr:hypothetical protein [bacterium]MBU1636550.1 hypothetical protein [bacterium]